MEYTPWNSYYTDADVDPAATADEDLTDAFHTNPRDAFRIENNRRRKFLAGVKASAAHS